MKTDMLVVAAHPDDEVLGCGGTIFRKAHEESDVFIAILGEGITSRYDNRKAADDSETETLHQNCRKVANLLNAKDLFMYNLPDNRFDTVPLLDITKLIEKLVQKIRPSVIFSHSGGDLNIDHVITHRAVMTAVRPMVQCPVKDIYAFEIPSSTEWAFQQFQPIFKPNVFFDISQSIDHKLEALACYDGEARIFPHPRSPEAIRSISRRWGSVVGLEYAEAFELVRMVR